VGATFVAAKELITRTVIVANFLMFMQRGIQAIAAPNDKPILPFSPRKLFFHERRFLAASYGGATGS
jgi:hypothetical protein